MLEQEIDEIIRKQTDIIPLLKKLTSEDKRNLTPFLKKRYKEITEVRYITTKTNGRTNIRMEQNHTDKQKDIINKACFVCFNKTDAKRTIFNLSFLVVDDDYLANIIPWYKPSWYNDIFIEDTPWGLYYLKMMKLYKEGLIERNRSLILSTLPNSIIQTETADKKYVRRYAPEQLLVHEETLAEDIWLLFEEETSINNQYDYLNIENYNGGKMIWNTTLLDLVEQQKIDRKRLLIATLHTSTKGFNKTLSGWFFDLLIALDPTEEEIIELQSDFSVALYSPHSKVVNTVLKYFKQVIASKDFHHHNFVEYASILLNSETKSVVNSTLMLLEKIVKIAPELTEDIGQKTLEALINTDEKIQVRAAKLIAKIILPVHTELLTELEMYANNLYHSSQEILSDHIAQKQATIEEEVSIVQMDFLDQENLLPAYTELDEMIYFVSQVIDNNEDYHIELLLSLLPKMDHILTEESVDKLEPIFKRSFERSLNFEWSNAYGQLEIETAYYINDYAEIVMKRFPEKLQKYRKIKKDKIEKFDFDNYFGEHYRHALTKIEAQHISDYIYHIHKTLFIRSKTHIKKGITLDFLSLPTHTPCWIDPEVLIQRIISYEQQNVNMDFYDFQLAIGRLPRQEPPKNIETQINQIKDPNAKTVLKYHFGLLDLEKVDSKTPGIWLQSVLTRNVPSEVQYFQEMLSSTLQKEIGMYDWKCTQSEHFYQDYDYVTKQKIQKKHIRRELELQNFRIKEVKNESVLNNLKGFFNKKKTPKNLDSIYQHFRLQKERHYTQINLHDDVKFLYLAPNNPGPFLSLAIHYNLYESTFQNETSKKNTVNILKGLHSIWYRSDYNEATYLFLATALLCSEKVSRELAAEIWIKANSMDQMNTNLFGEILGKLEHTEYAPLKRFTDLLSQNLLNVSKKLNASLYATMEIMIGKMNNTPIKGTKKLLELFLELHHTQAKESLEEACSKKLSAWSQNKSLKPIVRKLI
ncbi:MAG: DUF6493 family protein [Saprospiraceae bacterium]|nr:DUF6493 family protein [Saprospiraceae bacterium]